MTLCDRPWLDPPDESRALSAQESSHAVGDAGVTADWVGRTSPSTRALYPLELCMLTAERLKGGSGKHRRCTGRRWSAASVNRRAGSRLGADGGGARRAGLRSANAR